MAGIRGLAVLMAWAWCAHASTNTPLATVPISFSHGQVMVSARVNSSDPLSFLLDTGFTLTMLRPEVAERLQLRRVGEITVEGIAGNERAPTYEGAVFDIGGATYRARRVGAMTHTRRKRDGIIGSGLFRQYVVMVNVTAKQLQLFSPSNFTYSGAGEIVPLHFRRSTPIVDAAVVLTSDALASGQFEIDTGCDSAVCVGHEFTAQHQLLDAAETQSSGKVGVGGGTRTRNGRLPELRLGKVSVKEPETDFFLEGSPVDAGLAGHIGMEALKRFRVFFDYSRSRMILEPQ